MKERKNNLISNLEGSFDDLELGEIVPESDGQRAIIDAIRFQEEKTNVLQQRAILSLNFDVGLSLSSLNTYDIGAINKLVDKKNNLISENSQNEEYINVFTKLSDWLDQGFIESGHTISSKINFVKEKFGIKDQEEKGKKPDKSTEIEPKDSRRERYEKSCRPYIPAHPGPYGYPEESRTPFHDEGQHSMWPTRRGHRKRYIGISLLSGQSQETNNNPQEINEENPENKRTDLGHGEEFGIFENGSKKFFNFGDLFKRNTKQ